MEIRVRAWDQLEKTMIDSDDLAFEEYAPIVFLLNDDSNMIYMLNTGIKDSKGKNVFAGDIIKYKRKGQDHIGFINQIGCEWMIDGVFELAKVFRRGEIEVIGNIYQNPNMIEEFYK